MDRVQARRDILRQSSLMACLADEELLDLANASRISRFTRQEQIWNHGAETAFFGIVGTGFVRMSKSAASGSELTLDVMGPGQIFGLLGTVDGLGCSLMAHALTDVVILRVPKGRFMEVYETNHSLKDQLIRRTSIRMHQKLNLMAKLASGRVEERIAAVLVILADSYGESSGEGIEIELPLTRQQIGEMAGTTTESTIRLLSKWTREGLVSTYRHRIRIADVDRLRAI